MKQTEYEIKSLTIWQNKLLPYTIAIIAFLTVFFFAASFVQLYYLHQRIEKSPDLNMDSVLQLLDSKAITLSNADRLNFARWETLALLERHALQRRYHQANVLLMARVWTSYLGFVTGMILSLVGAMFILGKLRESESKLNAEGSLWKFSVVSASPGLVLTILGVTLMIITIITHFEIEVNDGPLFTSAWNDNNHVLPSPKIMERDSIAAKLQELFNK